MRKGVYFLFEKDGEAYVGTVNFAKKGHTALMIPPPVVAWMRKSFTFGFNTRINGYLAQKIREDAESFWSHISRSGPG
jgi:hypothetical protein